MKKVTRRQIRSWLGPIRKCFSEMRSGEVDAIRGYAVTRLNHNDEYARIDFCIAGFRALLSRLCPNIEIVAIERIEKKLAAGIPLTVSEIDSAMSLLNRCEDALIKLTYAEINNAALDEQIRIQFDMREAA